MPRLGRMLLFSPSSSQIPMEGMSIVWSSIFSFLLFQIFFFLLLKQISLFPAPVAPIFPSDFVVTWLSRLDFTKLSELESEQCIWQKVRHTYHTTTNKHSDCKILSTIHSRFLHSAVHTDPWSEISSTCIHIHSACTEPLQSAHKDKVSAERSLQAAGAASTFSSSPLLSSSSLALSPSHLPPARWQRLPSFSCSSGSRNCSAIHHPPNRSSGKGIVSWSSIFSWQRTCFTKGSVGTESSSGTQHCRLSPSDLTYSSGASFRHGESREEKKQKRG